MTTGQPPETSVEPSVEPSVEREPAAAGHPPARDSRPLRAQRLAVRLIATCGVIAIGIAIAAIMVSSKSQGWIVGLVVSVVSVLLTGLLWSSRRL